MAAPFDLVRVDIPVVHVLVLLELQEETKYTGDSVALATAHRSHLAPLTRTVHRQWRCCGPMAIARSWSTTREAERTAAVQV